MICRQQQHGPASQAVVEQAAGTAIPFNAANPFSDTTAAEHLMHLKPPAVPHPQQHHPVSALPSSATEHSQPSIVNLATTGGLSLHEAAAQTRNASEMEVFIRAQDAKQASHTTVSQDALAKFDSIQLDDGEGKLVFIDGMAFSMLGPVQI